MDAGGQLAAILDLPEGIPEGPYTIRVRRVIRKLTDPDVFEDFPVTVSTGSGSVSWIGWANGSPGDPSTGIPIYIVPEVSVPGGGTLNTLGAEGWFALPDLPPQLPVGEGSFGSVGDFSQEAVYALPRPKAEILIGDWVDQQGPAALDFALDFPADRVEILGVSVRTKHKTSVFVAWDADPPSACGGPTTGRLNVHLMDPKASTSVLEVAYRLLNFETSCRGRLEVGDLVVDPNSVAAYDIDGEPLAQLPAGLALPTVIDTRY